MKSGWKIGYYVATYILALIAIVGFVFSIITSRCTSEILKDMQKELEYSNKPLITIDSHGWVKEKEEDRITCDNPPTGIYVKYRNVSNVPIQVYKINEKFFYGEMPFPDPVTRTGEATSYILAPGGEFKRVQIRKELFQKYFRDKKGVTTPPFIKIEAEVEFSRLGSAGRYNYKTTKEIGYDCSIPDSSQMFTRSEEISAGN